MADNDLGSEAAPAVASNGGIMKIIIIAVAIIVLVVGSIMATLFMTGVIGGGSKSGDVAAEHGAEANNEESGNSDKGHKGKEPIYYAFDPAFVVNFNDGKSIRYLQVTLEIMTYDSHVVEDVERHMPVIRNNLIMMFSSLNYEVLNTVAGKRKLQDEALSEIQSILLDKSGKEGVDEVYFTSFVMQ